MSEKPEWLTRAAEMGVLAACAITLVVALRPLASAGRQSSDAVSCADNERRIGMAMMLYVDDNDGCFPPNRSSNSAIWKDSLSGYIKAPPATKATALFRCPSNVSRSTMDESTRWPVSYAYNASIAWGKQVTKGTSLIKRSDFPEPSGFMILLETRESYPDLGVWFVDGVSTAADGSSWSNPNVRWHNGNPSSRLGVFQHHQKQMNVVMLDGRVAAVTLPKTIAAPQMWSPWNPPDAYAYKANSMVPEYK